MYGDGTNAIVDATIAFVYRTIVSGDLISRMFGT